MLLLMLLGCPAVNYYYPEMGSNNLTWRPEGVSEDTSDPGGTDDSGGAWDGLTQVHEAEPADAPICATGDPSQPETFTITNSGAAKISVFAVLDDCSEVYKTEAATGQLALINGNVGGSYSVRDWVTGDLYYNVLLGTDGGGMVIK